MRWPWDKPRVSEARQARERAEVQLARLRARREEVDTLAGDYRDERDRNHFGENIETIFRGRAS